MRQRNAVAIRSVFITLSAIVVICGFVTAAAAQDEGSVRRTAFIVNVHGWQFENAGFRLCETAECVVEHGGALIPAQFLSTTYPWALCGGMSLSALRRFREARPVEQLSYEVKDELRNAQVETVNVSTNTFWRYTSRLARVRPTLGQSTNQYWQIVKQSIDKGEPIILGLIYARSRLPHDVFKNHQVLAIGYETRGTERPISIIVYDPNFPAEESRIELLLEEQPGNFAHIAKVRKYKSHGVSTEHRRCVGCTDEIFGFFPIPIGTGPTIVLPVWHVPALSLMM